MAVHFEFMNHSLNNDYGVYGCGLVEKRLNGDETLQNYRAGPILNNGKKLKIKNMTQIKKNGKKLPKDKRAAEKDDYEKQMDDIL